MLGESLHIASKYLTQEAKVTSLTSSMEALEEENSTLKRKLIKSMLLATKEKLKTIATRSVEAFQQTDEYNTVLFNWYFKGFELLRRYLVKHPTGVDLQSLDLEVVDQEMAIDEAAQSSAPEDDVLEKAPADDAATGVTLLLVMTLLLAPELNTCENFFFSFVSFR